MPFSETLTADQLRQSACPEMSLRSGMTKASSQEQAGEREVCDVAVSSIQDLPQGTGRRQDRMSSHP
jgi:hypothetical protein